MDRFPSNQSRGCTRIAYTFVHRPRFIVVLEVFYPSLAINLFFSHSAVPSNSFLCHVFVDFSFCNGFVVVDFAVVGNLAPEFQRSSYTLFVPFLCAFRISHTFQCKFGSHKAEVCISHQWHPAACCTFILCPFPQTSLWSVHRAHIDIIQITRSTTNIFCLQIIAYVTTFPTAQIGRNDLFGSCCFQCVECSDIFRSQVVDLEEKTFTWVVVFFQIIHEADRSTVHVND